MEKHTAKHFVLQLGSLISLYLSLSFLLVLLFGVINLTFPDIAEGVWRIEGAASSVRIGIAIVLVFFPTYIILTRQVNKIRREEKDGSYLGLTKWLIYLSLLVGGIVMLADLVSVLMAFLEGEITQRFVLKATAVLVVVGAAFNYYLMDAKGYWLDNERRSIIFGSIVAAFVLASVILGLQHIDTPSEVREKNLDSIQVNDLRDIQWRVIVHLSVNNELPETLEDIYVDEKIPAAPEGREDYSYELIDNGFNLCATFLSKSNPDKYPYDRQPNLMDGATSVPTVINAKGWSHDRGYVCFKNELLNKEDEAAL